MNEISNTERIKLIEKAADSTDEGIVISDATQSHNPIIYANAGFYELTGYSESEVLGNNCRFLQGEGTDSDALHVIRDAIAAGESCRVELLNYRKDGSQFWNRLTINPIYDDNGNVVNHVGIQSDISELRKTQKKLEDANYELSKFHREVTEELEQARRAQQFILPRQLPQSPYYRISSKFVPLTQIGGDFFDVFHVDDDRLGLLIADVTGHGIPAALLTFMSSTTFKDVAPGNPSPADVLKKVNDRLHNRMPDGTFVTMYYAIYNTKTRELAYAQAGHPPALVLGKEPGDIRMLKTAGSLVGIFPEALVQFIEDRMVLKPGEKLVLFTDAITESFTPRDEEFKTDHLADFLNMRHGQQLQTVLDDIYTNGLVYNGKGYYQDDATLLGLEVMR